MAYSSAVVVTPVDHSRDGVTTTTLPTTPTATHGNKFLNDQKTYLEVANGSGSEITVTISIPKLVDGQAVTPKTVTVAAGARKKIGPFTEDYSQADGYVWVTFSAVATITIGAFRFA